MKYTTTALEHLLIRREPNSFVTTPVEYLWLSAEGIVGEENYQHTGHFVTANVRNDGFRGRGDPLLRQQVFNHRQISVIDSRSLEAIGDGLDIDPDVVAREYDQTRTLFLARHIGANVVVGAISSGENFHDIEPPYHLGPFDQEELFISSMLVVSYNEPCVNPGRAIAKAYPGSTEFTARKFVEVARACRGFVGVTSLAGGFRQNDEAMIVPLPKVPDETTT